jgi:hypothetical protein
MCGGESVLQEQRHEAGLLEIMVAREGLGHLDVAHDNEAEAISQRPILVGSLAVQIHPTSEEDFSGWNDRNVRVSLQGLLEREETGTVAGDARASATSVRM